VKTSVAPPMACGRKSFTLPVIVDKYASWA